MKSLKRLICWLIGHDFWRIGGQGPFVCRRCGKKHIAESVLKTILKAANAKKGKTNE